MTEFVFRDPAAPRRVRVALLAAAVVVATVAAGFLWTRVADLRDEIASLDALVAQSAARTGTGTADPDRYYDGETLQLAQTQLQRDMQALADAHQIRLEVIRADEIEQSGGNIRLGLVLNGVVPEAAIGAFLSDLAAHRPVVAVEALTLRRARATRRAEQARQIAFQLELSGYARR